MTRRKRLYDILDPNHRQGLLSRTANWIIYGLIFLNVVGIILESIPALHRSCRGWFLALELVTVAVFSGEYLLRVWVCVENPRFARPILGRLRYLVSAMALIDLLAILPFYLSNLQADWVILRTVRFFRLFRIAKLGRYSTAFQVLGGVLHARRAELTLTLFIIFMLAVLSGIGIYHAESEAQPQAFPDIPTAVFWAVQALTNVSHVETVTPAGKALATAISLLGVGMIALPTGILGAGFVEESRKRLGSAPRCPHCGKDLDARP